MCKETRIFVWFVRFFFHRVVEWTYQRLCKGNKVCAPQLSKRNDIKTARIALRSIDKTQNNHKRNAHSKGADEKKINEMKQTKKKKMVWCDSKFIKGNQDKSENLFASTFYFSLSRPPAYSTKTHQFEWTLHCNAIWWRCTNNHQTTSSTYKYYTNHDRTKTIIQISPYYGRCDCEYQCKTMSVTVTMAIALHPNSEHIISITKCDTKYTIKCILLSTATTPTEKSYSCINRSRGD